MSSTSRFVKDPDAVLDYQVDWTTWLATGETITASSWTLATGIVQDSESHDGTTATIWLSGGTTGQRYLATNHVVTSQGREDDRTITIDVRER
jgi:hypothetical protein